MPRTNPGRTSDYETVLADRIEVERLRRKLSYAQLAELMGEVGVAIAASGIQKIERATPRRRISLDEAVGFAKVFGMTLESLVTAPEAEEDALLRADYERGPDLRRAVIDAQGSYDRNVAKIARRVSHRSRREERQADLRTRLREARIRYGSADPEDSILISFLSGVQDEVDRLLADADKDDRR